MAKTFVQTREPDLKGPFDEWLARIICFAFSISPQALTQQMNRATAETQKEISEEEELAPILAWVKALIDDVLADEFDSADREFAWSTESSIDPATQEAILTSYATKGILTINEARIALGRGPLTGAAANTAMVLTGAGLCRWDTRRNRLPNCLGAPAKDNPYHDERGRFTTADGVGDNHQNDSKLRPERDDGLAFAGVLIDKRFDEVINITHCTYSTPLGTFTLEVKGHMACPNTYPAPF